MLIHPWDAYIPTTWRAKGGGPDEDGVPTSCYYSAVQLTCRAEIVDDPQDKAELLRRQLAISSREATTPKSPRTCPLRPHVLRNPQPAPAHHQRRRQVQYDDHNPQAHRAQIAGRLESRGTGRDRSAATQQRRRLHEIGEWKPRR